MNKDIKHGFKINDKTYIKEVGSTVYEYIHERTKAKIIFLKNKSEDKSFTIGFKTIPEDNTGVAHIIEHSVFCGSEKYNIKEPFVELMKGSLNTFLNAMTFADKTIYPVASQNEEDLLNLIDVYCDAVFNPNIKKIESIFMQEGWHYEIQNNQLIRNGVVYNEMRGAFSDPMQILQSKVNETMFTNCYKYESGGNPKYIPNLTFDKFIEFYEKFYHPSNSCTVIYGDLDIDKILAVLDAFFSKYDYKKIENEIKPTEKIEIAKVETFKYSIGNNEPETNRTFASINYMIDKSVDNKMKIAFEILGDILVNSEMSPIKHELFAKGLCSNISCRYDYFKSQSVFAIWIYNTEAEKILEISEIIQAQLEKIVKDKINREALDAAVNSEEFKTREITNDFAPNSVKISLELVNRWSYDEKNTIDVLYYENELSELKKWADENKFEEVIKEYLLDNTSRATVILKPEKGLAEREYLEESINLKNIMEKLSEEEINSIIKSDQILKKRQLTPDSKEELKCMRLLDIKDLKKKDSGIEVNKEKLGASKLLHYDINTNDIFYGTLRFNSGMLDNEEIKYLAVLAQLLGALSTKETSYQSISRKIMCHSGGVNFYTNAFAEMKNDKNVHKTLNISFKALNTQISSVIEIIKDIILNTVFDDTGRILLILNRLKSNVERSIASGGNGMVISKINAMLTETGRYNDVTTGIEFYEFISEFIIKFEKKSKEIIDKLNEIMKKIFTKNGLISCVTSSGNDKLKFVDAMKSLTDELEEKTSKELKIESDLERKIAIGTTSNVQYVGLGYDINKLGYRCTGALMVAKTILKTEYLWNNIRLIGGAYGAILDVRSTGEVILCSYRDPQLKNTLDVYKGIPNFLRNIEKDKELLGKYIIGTIKELDKPMLPEMEGGLAFKNYLSNISKEDIIELRNEVLNVSFEDIVETADIFDRIINKELVVVIGNKDVIDGNKNLFDEVNSI